MRMLLTESGRHAELAAVAVLELDREELLFFLSSGRIACCARRK
jgi:hypothetical protein